jgi:putative ABC transport system permease protein
VWLSGHWFTVGGIMARLPLAPELDRTALVGGIGIANVMVISVLERRGEIGLRGARGARRRHVAAQFVAEAGLLAAAGGAVFGGAATAGYAAARHWSAVVPVPVLAGAVAAAVLIGVTAGLYPAGGAARPPPAEVLRIL